MASRAYSIEPVPKKLPKFLEKELRVNRELLEDESRVEKRNSQFYQMSRSLVESGEEIARNFVQGNISKETMIKRLTEAQKNYSKMQENDYSDGREQTSSLIEASRNRVREKMSQYLRKHSKESAIEVLDYLFDVRILKEPFQIYQLAIKGAKIVDSMKIAPQHYKLSFDPTFVPAVAFIIISDMGRLGGSPEYWELHPRSQHLSYDDSVLTACKHYWKMDENKLKNSFQEVLRFLIYDKLKPKDSLDVQIIDKCVEIIGVPLPYEAAEFMKLTRNMDENQKLGILVKLSQGKKKNLWATLENLEKKE